jgi:hypothetical protein
VSNAITITVDVRVTRAGRALIWLARAFVAGTVRGAWWAKPAFASGLKWASRHVRLARVH